MHLPSGEFTPDGGFEGGCLSSVLAFAVVLIFISWGIDSCNEALFGVKVTKVTPQQYEQSYDSDPNYYNEYAYAPQVIDEKVNTLNNTASRNRLTGELALEYYYKISNSDINKFAEEFLDRFDENYDKYVQNEFLLRDKILSTKETLKTKLEALELDRIFDTVIHTQFSDYDFEKHCFHFTDFPSDNETKAILWGRPALSITFVNFSEFNRIFIMEEPKARELVEQKISENQKTVFLKVFYSLQTEIYEHVGSERIMYAKVSKVEVWADRETVTWKLAEFLPIEVPNNRSDSPSVYSDSVSVETPDSFYRQQNDSSYFHQIK